MVEEAPALDAISTTLSNLRRQVAVLQQQVDEFERLLHALVEPNATSLRRKNRTYAPPLPGSSSARNRNVQTLERIDSFTPFSWVVLSQQPPASFQTYDGTTDPLDHLMHFRQTRMLREGDDALLCKVFPASLIGPALAWYFYHLLRGSIDSYHQLAEAFVMRLRWLAHNLQNLEGHLFVWEKGQSDGMGEGRSFS